MAVNPDLLGRSYPRTEPIDVTAERVAAFARAVFATAVDAVEPAIPPTFPILIQQATLDRLLGDETAGIELSRVVHGEQRFAYARPIVIGDRLTGELTVTGLRALGPATMLTAETVIRDASDAVVVTATSVLVVGSDEAVPT